MNIRDTDGFVVVEGDVTQHSRLLYLYRFPSRFIPDNLIQQTNTILMVFWLFVIWTIYRAYSR